MTKVNKKTIRDFVTHEGGKASRTSSYLQLRRSVMACILWENSAYEDGESITERIAKLIPKVDPELVATIAVEARQLMKLRSVPVFIASEMLKHETHKPYVANLLPKILLRPDQMSELIAIYWKNGKKKLPAQLVKGLAKTFVNFDEYQLAKYNRDVDIKLRDVLFLSHARPLNDEQDKLWKKLIGRFCSNCWKKIHPINSGKENFCSCKKPEEAKLQIPYTWEVELSSNKDKKSTWTKLLKSGKIPANALLKNIRNCAEARVDRDVIVEALDNAKVERLLPFEIMLANKYANGFEKSFDSMLMKLIANFDKLKGKTLILVDTSGSMYNKNIARRSDMTRADAAASLAILLREVCESSDVITFSLKNVKVDGRGFKLAQQIHGSQLHNATHLMRSLNEIKTHYDRIIIITDEQSDDGIPEKQHNGAAFQYILNVSVEKNGVGYGNWMHIDGFSENVIRYINEYEKFSLENEG